MDVKHAIILKFVQYATKMEDMNLKIMIVSVNLTFGIRPEKHVLNVHWMDVLTVVQIVFVLIAMILL